MWIKTTSKKRSASILKRYTTRAAKDIIQDRGYSLHSVISIVGVEFQPPAFGLEYEAFDTADFMI
jgi:hypothetical protein